LIAQYQKEPTMNAVKKPPEMSPDTARRPRFTELPRLR
jgi:hypothetical protein